jgi:hypothetical protein
MKINPVSAAFTGMERVNRVATDYSPEEQARFRDVFAPRAARYRRYSRLTLLIAASAFVGWFLAIRFLPPRGLGWICGVLFVGLLASVVYSWISRPLLECPACYNHVDSWPPGRYCPECGSDHLRTRTWLLAPKCDACGAVMWRGKGRRYTIRACTHCGVLLDAKGV